MNTTTWLYSLQRHLIIGCIYDYYDMAMQALEAYGTPYGKINNITINYYFKVDRYKKVVQLKDAIIMTDTIIVIEWTGK